jgi:hypothetical protein
MSQYVQVWKAKVSAGDVAELLAVRPAAIAEARRLCPALVRAQLVRVDDEIWLDVLTWSAPDGEEQLMANSENFDALHRMHSFLKNAEPVGRGEVVASA